MILIEVLAAVLLREGFRMKRTELEWTEACGEQASLSAHLNGAEEATGTLPRIIAALTLFLVLGMSISARADQYTAYSLKVAQQRIERAGKNWRQKEPEVASLGGINKVEGFVFDSAGGDLILVGQKEQGRAGLTLDDLVVALRARFRFNEWPLVSIDPTPDTDKTQMQHVRFAGGIQDTAFGQALFDADYRLKELSMGLAKPGIGDFRTAWDSDVEEVDGGGSPGQREVSSRFWFYPINPYVTVREGVCVVRGLKVGVFTEVLSAKIDGRPVEDVKALKNATNDTFAKDVSERFDDLCRAHPSFNRLRGLQELVAVSKALEDSAERADFSYWLEKYPVAQDQTPRQAKVLRRRYDGNRGWFEVAGGVRLTALAMRLNAGDVMALREAVLKMRPSPAALKWEFVSAGWLVSLEPGQAKPEDIAAMFAQAVFLQEQGRHADAIELYDDILAVNPKEVGAYDNRAIAYAKTRDYDRAIADLDKAIALAPRMFEAWSIRGSVLLEQGKYGDALADLNRALELNPHSAYIHFLRGLVFVKEGKYDQAVPELISAVQVKPEFLNDFNGDNPYADWRIAIQSTVTYMEQQQDESGRWVWRPAKGTVRFGPNLGGEHSVMVVVGSEKHKCPVRLQTIGTRQTNEGVKQVKLSGYGGAPFLASPVEVDASCVLEQPHVISIAGSANGCLIPEQDSAVLFDVPEDGCGQVKPWSHALGVTWLFAQQGISFISLGHHGDSTSVEKFVSDRIGASIKFTTNGVVLEGMSRVVFTKDPLAQSVAAGPHEETFQGWLRANVNVRWGIMLLALALLMSLSISSVLRSRRTKEK